MLNAQPHAEAERCALNLTVAASSWNATEFSYHEALAQESGKHGGPPMARCFGVHPQLPRAEPDAVNASLETLYQLVNKGKLAAIGEVGFDFFDEPYKATETLQEELFHIQLNLAVTKGLPIILHLRRAMHKMFKYTKNLARLPAVVFHSYSGTYEEALALRKRGIKAFCSFGTTIALNHRKTMRACALLPQDMLLFETDAPYQPLRGQPHSRYKDLFTVVRTAALLRAEADRPCCTEEALHVVNDVNFQSIYRTGMLGNLGIHTN